MKQIISIIILVMISSCYQTHLKNEDNSTDFKLPSYITNSIKDNNSSAKFDGKEESLKDNTNSKQRNTGSTKDTMISKSKTSYKAKDNNDIITYGNL